MSAKVFIIPIAIIVTALMAVFNSIKRKLGRIINKNKMRR